MRERRTLRHAPDRPAPSSTTPGDRKARTLGLRVAHLDIGAPDRHQAFTWWKQLPPTVALTGYALPEDLERAQAAGFARHLAKPPSLEKLGEILAAAP